MRKCPWPTYTYIFTVADILTAAEPVDGNRTAVIEPAQIDFSLSDARGCHQLRRITEAAR